jgi:hypothetical protein
MFFSKIFQDLNSIQVSAKNDIITLARSSSQPTEIGILLYDIYVC